jgi:hypothetical protein
MAFFFSGFVMEHGLVVATLEANGYTTNSDMPLARVEGNIQKELKIIHSIKN